MSEKKEKYRLVTRSDFDGLACAVLLKELDLIDEIKFVHPKDMQDGLIEITEKDITTNLPYVEGCHLCFDHHRSEEYRNLGNQDMNYVLVPNASSAARVVYDYYGEKEVFKNVSQELMQAVDKADTAQFSMVEILRPKGWDLLSFIMDARTGLGRYRNFRISNYQLMMNLIEACRTLTINEILEIPDVKERIDLYMSHQDKFEEQIKKCSKVYGNVVVLDWRNEETIYVGNRFVLYALFPQCNVSITCLNDKEKQKSVFAVGKSILDRTCKKDIGLLMLKNGGGGHTNAGTCQIENKYAENVLDKIVNELIINELINN